MGVAALPCALLKLAWRPMAWRNPSEHKGFARAQVGKTLRPSQKGLGKHSRREPDTYAALAKIRGVPSLAPPSWVRCSRMGWIMASAALAGICTCHVHIVAPVGSCHMPPVGTGVCHAL